MRGVYLTRGVEKTCMWVELHPFGYPGNPWDDRHHHAAGCSREEHSRDDVLYPEMKCDVLYPVPGRETQLSDIETQQHPVAIDVCTEMSARRCLHGDACTEMSARRCLHGDVCTEMPARRFLYGHVCIDIDSRVSLFCLVFH